MWRMIMAGKIAAILDGGATQVGLESTIVACLGGVPRLLRPGGVSREKLEAVLGFPLTDGIPASAAPSAPVAPGMLTSHYAPRARVRLDAVAINPGEAALLFGSVSPGGLDNAVAVRNLSEAGDLREAATNLFSAMRALDETGATGIAVTPRSGTRTRRGDHRSPAPCRRRSRLNARQPASLTAICATWRPWKRAPSSSTCEG